MLNMMTKKRKESGPAVAATTHAYEKNHVWARGDSFTTAKGAYVLTYVPDVSLPVPMWTHVWPKLWSYNTEDACVMHMATAKRLADASLGLFFVTTQIAPMELEDSSLELVWQNSQALMSADDVKAYAIRALRCNNAERASDGTMRCFFNARLFTSIQRQSDAQMTIAYGRGAHGHPRTWENPSIGIPDGSFNFRAGKQSVRAHPVDGPKKARKKPAIGIHKGPLDTPRIATFFTRA